jgi:hypothetical protein
MTSKCVLFTHRPTMHNEGIDNKDEERTYYENPRKRIPQNGIGRRS